MPLQYATKLAASVWILLAAFFDAAICFDPDPVNLSSLKVRIRVACIGDSITYGDGSQPLKGPLGENKVSVTKHEDRGSYPQTLQELLEAAMPGVFQVGMFAVGGTTAMFSRHLTLGRHRCHKDSAGAEECGFIDTMAWKKAIEFQPHVVLLMLGTNDAKDTPQRLDQDLFGDLTWIMGYLSASMPYRFRGNRWVMLPPRVYDNPYNINHTVLEASVWPILTQAAVKEHWEVIGLQFALDHQRAQHFGQPHEPKSRGVAARLHSIASTAIGYSKGDGVHPKAAGSRRLAHLVAPSLIARFNQGAPPLEPIGAPLEKAMRVVPGVSIPGFVEPVYPGRVDSGPERVNSGPERVDSGPERVTSGERVGLAAPPPADGFQTERSEPEATTHLTNMIPIFEPKGYTKLPKKLDYMFTGKPSP